MCDDAMARLTPLSKANLGVSLVFTAATVDLLLSNIYAFQKMGFGRITFNPELALGPDGRYSSCDKALSYPTGSAPALQTGGGDEEIYARARVV